MTKRSPTSKTAKSEAPAAPAVKRGRSQRPVYSREAAERICDRMACGESLRKICRDPGMPDTATVRSWVIKDVDGFAERYMRARTLQADAWVSEAVDTARDTRADPGSVARARLIVDTVKWTASHLLPHRYGDKVTAELTGHGGGAIKAQNEMHVFLGGLTSEELPLCAVSFGAGSRRPRPRPRRPAEGQD